MIYKISIFEIRNTSACAEKTGLENKYLQSVKKHLRLRGENRIKSMIDYPIYETPPLARRKQPRLENVHIDHGNTSACAEKTRLII